MNDNMLETNKTIEVKSDVIDRRKTGVHQLDGGRRYHLFVNIYRGDGQKRAAGIEFDNEEDAKNAQKLLHSVLNEVLA